MKENHQPAATSHFLVFVYDFDVVDIVVFFYPGT
jgi:hypothetical protein